MTAAVEIRNVNKFYGKFHALKDINLTVAHGEKIVICESVKEILACMQTNSSTKILRSKKTCVCRKAKEMGQVININSKRTF